MKFINLVINECIKIFKKKSTVIFLVISVLSFFIAYGIVTNQNNQQKENIAQPSPTNSQYILDKYKIDYKNSDGEKKKELATKIELYEFALKNNIYINDNFYNYRTKLVSELQNEMLKLNYISKDVMKSEYILQKVKVDKIKNIVENNDFNGYINYEKDKIKEEYKNKQITLEEYNSKIKLQDDALKYELGKNLQNYVSWKENLIKMNLEMESKFENRIDDKNKKYIDSNEIQKLDNEKLVNLYRLENNKPVLSTYLFSDVSTDSYFGENTNSYYRYNYNTLAITISMFFITILFIILACSSISEEISNGTIKFLIVSPFKRYKIILAKLLALSISLIVIVLILSQINTLLSNIFFSGASNEYIYAENGVVKVLNTNAYETVQFLLKTPEIFIYILLAMAMSTLFRSTIVSNTITMIVYAFSSFVMFITSLPNTSVFDEILKLDFMKYLPMTNFNFIDKILPVYTGLDKTVNINTTLQFSFIVFGVTAVLLLITMFESFNKKDI